MAGPTNNQIASLTEWAGGARATLVITFTDVVQSTELTNRLLDEAMRAVRAAHFKTSDALIVSHGGRRIKGLGDGHMAIFRVAEDALDYATALHAEPGHPEVEVRAGIHVGPVDVEEDDVFGGEVNFAARVGSATKAGEIWISDAAKAQVDRLGGQRHAALRWRRHLRVPLNGFRDTYTLWSLVADGGDRCQMTLPAMSMYRLHQ